MLISAQTTCQPFGTYDFTPEGYAKISYWRPEDGYLWEDFGKGVYHSIEEWDATKAEFEAYKVGKTEITKDHYYDKSLRSLMPDRWTLSYTKDKAWRVVG